MGLYVLPALTLKTAHFVLSTISLLMILTVNNDYLPKQLKKIGLCNGDAVCSL